MSKIGDIGFESRVPNRLEEQIHCGFGGAFGVSGATVVGGELAVSTDFHV